MRKFTLVIVSLFFIASSSLAQGYRGKNFWLAFPQNAIIEGDKHLSMSLFIMAEARAAGTITYLDSTIHFSVETGSSIEVQLDTDLEIISSGKTERKAVQVVSDHDISLYAVSHRPASTDSYMAIPTPYLGTDYAIAGYTSLSNEEAPFMSQATIVGTKKNTLVTIHLMGPTREGLPKGRSISFELDSGSTYQLQGSAKEGDLTGTTVSSTKPIAFFTGHSCAQVPPSRSYCNTLLEMEAPSNDWGKSYILTKFARKDYYVIRVIARDDSTVVSLNGEKMAWLMRGEYREFDTLRYDEVVTASRPVLVAQYGTSTTADSVSVGDPFMLLAIPDDRFVKEVTTTSVTAGSWENYLNVVVPDSGISAFYIDGALVTSGKFPMQITIESERRLSATHATIFSFRVPPGRHLLRCSAPIAVYSYGFGLGNDNYDSYGHACGMRLGQ